ncbi:MAG TPA: hypothetical protein DEU95_08645, partial [Chloroflexi bacterium]|nr:hypothetical protein [Chloroflexota bacterium]
MIRNQTTHRERVPMADSAALDPRYQQLWQSALSDLQGRISRANYETWLRSTTLLGVENGVATVAAPNAFAVDQLRLKFD